jgi:hypothetical protein
MSTPDESSALLASLEEGRQTGSLTIESADGRFCRVYILMGKVFHAAGPAGEGDAALADALSWPDVTLNFDERAQLPDTQTMTPRQIWGITAPSDAGTTAGRVQTLSDDRHLTVAMFAYIGAGCLFALVIVLGIGMAILEAAVHINYDSVLGTFVTLLFATGLLWLVLYLRYRIVFHDAAVQVRDGLAKADIPRVIDSPGLVSGETELVVTLPARYLSGRLGKCRVEFYATGIQIWKGPNHPVPHWQFPYTDLLQAESVVIEASGARDSRDQFSLRLIAAHPRMAFLFGSSFTNHDVQMMLEELRKHGVQTFTEA